MRRLSLFVLAAFAPAQQFVAELDPTPPFTANTRASNAIAGNGNIWFKNHTADTGYELWRSDGTAAGTHIAVDFTPGGNDSQVIPLLDVGGTLLVEARDPVVGDLAIWATNGTAAGTVRLIGGINYGGTAPSVLGVVNGRALIAEGAGVWSTDFTAAGTLVLATPGSITAATVHGNEVLLLAGVGGDDHLFATDGTYFVDRFALSGTARSNFTRMGAYDYFLASTPMQTFLVRTDGTAAGSTVVAPLGPPPSSNNGPTSIASIGSLLVFVLNGQLFRSDGTAAGTIPVAAPVPSFAPMFAVGTHAFFMGNDAATGEELWTTDGTSAGTSVLIDFEPGPWGSRYPQMVDVQGRLFAIVYSVGLSTTAALLTSDGTPAGTQTMPILNTGGWSLAAFGNECVATMVLISSTHMHLYASNGTLAGTRQLTSSVTTRPGVTLASPSPAVALGETLYFVAAEAAHGLELWRSDGTAAGTALVQDLQAGPPHGMFELAGFGGALYFPRGNALYRCDGTAAGTAVAVQPDPSAIWASGLVASNGVMLFRTSSYVQFRLWRTDGTPAGTVQIASTNQGIGRYRQIGALTYYTAQHNLQPFLARSDGTPGGTVVLGLQCQILGELGGRLVFSSYTGPGADLKITDGTVAGTQLIGHINEELPLTATRGGTMVLVGDDGIAYATDGATIVTLPVPHASVPVAALDAIYLRTDDPAGGRALYRTDGTIAGTALAVTVGSGVNTGMSAVDAIAAGNRLFLNANDGVSGFEPWISDGTQAGTARLADLAPNGNSDPQLLGVAGHRAFFIADDGVRGRELWSLDLGAIGAANTQLFARGCAGTFGVPRLLADGAPLLGNSGFALVMDRCVPAQLMLWLGGDGIGSIPIGGGCELLPANIYFTQLTFTDAAGNARLPLAVPNNQALVGLQLTMQGSALDPLGQSVFGSTVTPGMILVVGR